MTPPPAKRVRLGAHSPADPAVVRASRGGFVACDATDATAIANDPARNRGPPTFIDKRELLRRIPYSYVSIWTRMKAGQFPLPRRMFGKNVWAESEVDAWLSALPRREYPEPRE